MISQYPIRLAGAFPAAVAWAVVLSGLVAAQGLSALAVIVVARSVPPPEYGEYLSCYALTSLLVVLPAFGMDSWLLANGAARREELARLWLGALRTRVLLLAVWLICVTALVSAFAAREFPTELVLLAGAGLAGDSVALLCHATLRAGGYHRQVTACQVAGGLALLIVTLSLPLGPGLIAVFAFGRMVVSALAAALAVWLASRLIGRGQTDGAIRPPLEESGQFALADAAVAVYTRFDLTLVAAVLGPGSSGVYGPALNLMNLCFLVPNALYLFALPVLGRAHRQIDGRFGGLAAALLAAQAATGVALAAGLALLAPTAIEAVFGTAYAPSAAIVRLLSPLLIAKSLSFGLGAILTASRRQAARTLVQLAVAGFNISANLAIIGAFGLSGVALVYVASEVLLCAGYAFVACRRRRVGIEVPA